MTWPDSVAALVRQQQLLGRAQPIPWHPPIGPCSIGGCFVCFPRRRPGPGSAGDPAWAAAVRLAGDSQPIVAVEPGAAGAAYEGGLLALREGPLLEAAVRRLGVLPEVLLVNATGCDHPRNAGLALHLGAVLNLPTVGVTHRCLLAAGAWPEATRGAHAPLRLENREVGSWLCTRDGSRPLAVHAGWRTDSATARAVVLAATSGEHRTPEPVRQARKAAREARTLAQITAVSGTQPRGGPPC